MLKNKASFSLPEITVIAPTGTTAPSSININNLTGILNSSGAILLRGFAFDTPELENLSNAFCSNFHVSATRHQRRQIQGDSYSTEVFGNNYTLLGHTEGSYRPSLTPPEICFFMCKTPPSEKGGETTLVDGAEYFKYLPEDLRLRLEEYGITYEMQWEKERWQNEFMVQDINELEEFLNNTSGVKYSLSGDNLHLFYTTKAITKSRAGIPVFATAMLAHLPEITHPYYINSNTYTKSTNRLHFGDGETIPASIINQLIDIHDSLLYKHVWQRNDVLVIDNTRYLHGRTMTERDCERVLISRFGRVSQPQQK